MTLEILDGTIDAAALRKIASASALELRRQGKVVME